MILSDLLYTLRSKQEVPRLYNTGLRQLCKVMEVQYSELRWNAQNIELCMRTDTCGTDAVPELDSEVLQLEHDYNSPIFTFEP